MIPAIPIKSHLYNFLLNGKSNPKDLPTLCIFFYRRGVPEYLRMQEIQFMWISKNSIFDPCGAMLVRISYNKSKVKVIFLLVKGN